MWEEEPSQSPSQSSFLNRPLPPWPREESAWPAESPLLHARGHGHYDGRPAPVHDVSPRALRRGRVAETMWERNQRK